MEKLRSSFSQVVDLKNPYLLYGLVTSNFVLFFTIYKLCGRFLPRLVPGFRNITQEDVKFNFVLRVVSSIHALLATIFGLLILYFDKNIYSHELLYKSYGITFTLCFVMGYLSYDLMMMISFKEARDFSAIGHHIVAITAYFYCVQRGVFPLIAIVRLTSEFSTPFINNRWFMLTINQKSTKLFQYNAYMIFFAFLICRVVPIIPIWARLFSLVGTQTWNDINLFYKCVCIFTSVPLDVLNTYWFYKIVKIFLKYRKDGNKSD